MNQLELESLITRFIKTELCDDSEHPLTSDTNLVTEGIVDSMGIARLIAYIESSFGTKIPAKDLIPSNFMSIKAIVAYLGIQQE
ncbi:MAG: acyl carrier protein [Opitutaceae bacterium]